VCVGCWPLHDIAITNRVWCLAHTRGVGGGGHAVRDICLWTTCRVAKIKGVFRANNRIDQCTLPELINESLVKVNRVHLFEVNS